jgi:very-short-patch-repair endonuclease
MLISQAKLHLPSIVLMGQNAANIAWSLAKLGHNKDIEFFDSLAESISIFLEYPAAELPVDRLDGQEKGKIGKDSYNNQELSNILWAYATIDHYNIRLFTAVCNKMKPLVSTFNGHDIATSLWSITSCGHVDMDLLPQLLFKLKLQIHNLKTQEVGMIAFSLPRLESTLSVLPAYGSVAKESIDEAISSCRESSKLLIREMRDRMMLSGKSDRVRNSGNNLSYLDFGAQEISAAIFMLILEKGADDNESYLSSSKPSARSSNSLSTRELDEFHEWLMHAAMSCMDSFRPNDLSNLLWTCAKSSSAPPGLMDKAISSLLPMLPSVQGTAHLAKVFWSLGRLGFKIDSKSREAFLRALIAASSPLLPSFGHQDLSNTLWAMSMFRLPPSIEDSDSASITSLPKQYLYGHFLRELVESLKAKMRDSPAQCDQRELSSNAVSMGRLNELIYDHDLMELIADESVSRIATLGGQEMGNLSWGFAKSCHRNDPMIAAIGRKIIEVKGKGLRTQEAANIACAFSSLGLSREWREVYHYLGPSSSSSFNTQDLANFSHAHAIASLYEPWLLSLLLIHIDSNEDMEWESQSTKMSLEMTQVLAYLLILEEEGHLDHYLEVKEDPRYIKLKNLAMRAYQANEASGSFVQMEVFKAVNATNRVLSGRFEGKCFLEMKTQDNLFSIDIAIPSEMLAIEVDGPSHFLNSHPHSYEGTTLLRNRLLQNRGWTVASFPVTRWRHKGSGNGLEVSQESYDAVSSLIETAIKERDQGSSETKMVVEKGKQTRRKVQPEINEHHLSERHFHLALNWLRSSSASEVKVTTGGKKRKNKQV